jgi:hypothetical protein
MSAKLSPGPEVEVPASHHDDASFTYLDFARVAVVTIGGTGARLLARSGARIAVDGQDEKAMDVVLTDRSSSTNDGTADRGGTERNRPSGRGQ